MKDGKKLVYIGSENLENKLFLSGKDVNTHIMIIGSTRNGKNMNLNFVSENSMLTEKEKQKKERKEKFENDVRLAVIERSFFMDGDKEEYEFAMCSIFDTLYDALSDGNEDFQVTNEMVKKVLMWLPFDLIAKGTLWSFSDTEVRDEIYVYINDNLDKLKTYLEQVN